MNAKSKGTARERQVRDRLRGQGYVVYRPGASLGCADLVALREGSPPKLVQVKSGTGSPYKHFPPAEREALKAEAAKAGAVAILCHWASRQPCRWISAEMWP